MASLYRDPKSPYWFIKFKAPGGKWRAKSLRPLRNNIPADTRRARAKRDAASLQEHTRGPQRDLWTTWVPAYIQARYTGETRTRERTFNIWRNLSAYLDEIGISSPQDLTYRHCMDYMPWRTRKAAHNTAKLELNILSVICAEAVRRGIIDKNPAAHLHVPSVKSKEKPELSDTDIARIRDGLKSCPDWMSHAFEIALHQGCRLSETALFVDDVDLVGNRIHFRRTKGDKPFTVPLNPALKPILKAMLTTAPANQSMGRIFMLPTNASRDFSRLFVKLGINVSFHSTRVTVASRLARAGYPISLAMKLLNHSSQLIHRQYQRFQVQDVAGAYEHLKFPCDKPLSETQDAPPANPEHDPKCP